jgi:hypothetical protein
MTQKLRETRYVRELAAAKLPAGAGGKASIAIERLEVKKDKQVKIRFSSWQGARMQARPLDLTEEELLPLFDAALRGGVFSEQFMRDLGGVLASARAPDEQPAPAQPTTDLEKVQTHFHDLIRSRAGDLLGDQASSLPQLSRDEASEEEPAWLPVEGMHGGFKYWWDPASSGLRLMSESWSRVAAGSGQLHEITPTGARLLAEGFV